MSLSKNLKEILELEERNTVSNAFGGLKAEGKTKSYSVAKIKDWLFAQELNDTDRVGTSLKKIKECLPTKRLHEKVVANLLRFSFLIELTNLTVGSTKMKTRWLPGLILMPQEGSFEPIQGTFKIGNDPRASSFEECCEIFIYCLNTVACKVSENELSIQELNSLLENTSVPYEFVFDYIDPKINPVHKVENIGWVLNDDIQWLIKARPIIWPSLNKQLKDKIQTKTYKTDRALTGKDKTNRAKRWEVLSDDFQHATLTECWSVERKLLTELVGFEGFPREIKEKLNDQGLLGSFNVSRCSVTLESLNFNTLLSPVVHGRSDYQVGHLYPLKRGGKHKGTNVCWQSSDGNRIQGDLTINETIELFNNIIKRKQELGDFLFDIVEEQIAQEA
ncbi:hypothetical protein [Methylobacter luteus]|uniref:hypothetical protein n=1 Tax=Methylobacter luteus TaxID=415 RepID=UPI000416C51E|nr:hypothetical protein [Methylobacter luteus]